MASFQNDLTLVEHKTELNRLKNRYLLIETVRKRSLISKIAITESKKWRTLISTALAAAVISFSSNVPAFADLNKYEAETRGEFGIGSAAQYGSADLRYSFSLTIRFLFVNIYSSKCFVEFTILVTGF